jgi:hypothetical protein
LSYNNIFLHQTNTFYCVTLDFSVENREVFFCIANILVRNKKPLQVGETVKQTFLDAGNVLLNELKNNDEIMQTTKGMPLFCQSVTRWVEGRGELKKCTSKTVVIFPYSSMNLYSMYYGGSQKILS